MERELLFVKVKRGSKSSEIMQVVDIFRGKIIDVSPDSLVAELTGGTDKVNAFLDLLAPYGIIEIARTGKVALSRGKN